MKRMGRFLLFLALLCVALATFSLPPRHYFREYVGGKIICGAVSDSGCYAVDVYP